MSTVASRMIPSSPQRDASATWEVIVKLLAGAGPTANRAELMSVAGIAASLISDRYPATDAITVTSDGPRTRIYCLYDEDAVDGSGSNEGALGFDPLKGEWAISLPCHADEIEWVSAALSGKSSRITVRLLGDKVEASVGTAATGAPALDLNGVFKL